MNNLSITSRILVAFASGALIAVFFLPAWRIDLFAPQYPEGLVMKIWINDIKGDVEVINGLNHYIGMKHITVDMFPEFKFLPYVVGFFMALGMAVAISGNRKFLFAYIVLTAIGGVLAMYDFYRWAYDYGHNLDPNAPIQVPGLSYQPPLFGHKRLLNFDAYSFPDVAGWIVIGAGCLAFGVWFFEWYRSRKARKRTVVAPVAVIMLSSLIFLSSCNPKPEPITLGTDVCAFCKMNIVDPKYGGEIVTKKTKVYKFDDLRCMAGFLREGTVAEKDIALRLVVDYEAPHELVSLDKAVLVAGPQLKSPMNGNVAGFSDAAAAERVKAEKSATLLTWKEFNQPAK